ncbi:MAG: aspartate kinase [Muribaculaceae bacterium]|nr:aspartate kinase [Muribaculaceae bacterium]
MKVLKFGGTSVGTVESLKNVKNIVDSIEGNAIVVVSALGGLTDKLISTAKKAASQDESWRNDMTAIEDRHAVIIKSLVKDELQDEVNTTVTQLLKDLKRNYEGIWLLRALPDQTLDVIVSYGERMSSVIVTAIVENGKRHDSLNFIKTEKWYGKNIADRKLTESLIIEEFKTQGENEKSIVPGFISTDTATGEITNLGRGGSDYTGALIAAALDADILEIWTDVDGFMTADPRIVKDAKVIDHLTFTESMELCSFGAKVIYPPTIYPVFHKNIPIKILNTFHAEAPGSLITDNSLKEDLPVKGVTSLKDTSLISFELKNENELPVLTNRAFNAISKDGIKIIPVSNPDNNFIIDIAVGSGEAGKALKLLEQELAPEISNGTISNLQLKNDLAALAIVGKDMRMKQRMSERIKHSLQRQNIEIHAMSNGSSDTTLLYIIDIDKTLEALPLVHSLVI